MSFIRKTWKSYLTFPADGFKGTRIERLKKFYLNVLSDYRQASVDLGKSVRNKPVRSAILGTLGLFSLYCNRNNPSEFEFYDSHLNRNLKLTLVSKSIRNPAIENYENKVELLRQHKMLRRLNLFVCSVMWSDNYSDELGLYAAQCKYLKPKYYEMVSSRVIDVGFLGKWWIAETLMKDYDVNPNEWNENGQPVNPNSL